MRVNEPIEHLFTHCLISHPEIAFKTGNDYGKYLDRDCLTPKEFSAILEVLNEQSYALVDIRETYELCENGAKRKTFKFPINKKPLILSFDDVVYARKNQGKGMSDRLVLSETGEILACTDNKTHKNEFVPILEDFIKKHPDFSVGNARGILFLTGFDGILGYRTERNSLNRAAETKEVKKLISALKQKGWIFGSHSYSHAHMRSYSAEEMQSDAEKWNNEVAPLIGTTDLYAYPYGEWCFGEKGDDKRQDALNRAGFKVFFGVGENPFYTKMPLHDCPQKVLFQDRCPLDGVSLRNGKLARLFDCEDIYDHRRPLPYRE